MRINQLLTSIAVVPMALGMTQLPGLAQTRVDTSQPTSSRLTSGQVRYSANELGAPLEVNVEDQVEILPGLEGEADPVESEIEARNLRPAFYGLFRRPYDESIELIEIGVD